MAFFVLNETIPMTNITLTTANGTSLPESTENYTTTSIPRRRTFFIPWNNPDNVITKDTSDDILFALQCVIFPIVTLFGSTGNIMSLVILLQRKMRTSTGVILISLTIADLCYLLTNMTRKSSCIIGRLDKQFEGKYTASIFGPIFFTITSFSRVSAWLVVLISIERVIAVSFPLKIKVWISRQRMIVAVVLIYALTFLLISPIAFQYKRGEMFNPMTNITTYYISPSQFYYDNEDFLAVHNEILATFLFRHLPVVLTMLFNFIIIVMLQRRTLKRQKMTNSKQKDGSQKAQDKITRMLLVISGVALLCTTPGSLLLIMSRVFDGFEFYGKYHNLFLVTSDFSTLLSMINSSVNFIIYMVFNKEFSDIYRRMFCRCWVLMRGEPGSTKTTSTSERTYSTKFSQNSKTAEAERKNDMTERRIENQYDDPVAQDRSIGKQNGDQEAQERSIVNQEVDQDVEKGSITNEKDYQDIPETSISNENEVQGVADKKGEATHDL